MYRPGQEVYIKALRRIHDGDRLLPFKAIDRIEVILSISDSDQEIIWQKKCLFSVNGSIDASFTLPGHTKPGLYRTLIDNVSAGSFVVKEYRLPTFTIDMTTSDKRWKPEETRTVSIDAAYISGRPVANAALEISIDSGDDTSIRHLQTDDKGHLDFSFTVPRPETNRRVSVRASASNASGRVISDRVSGYVRVDPIELRAELSPPEPTVGDILTINAEVSDCYGKPAANIPITVEGIDDRCWLSDANGKASIVLPTPALSGRHHVYVHAEKDEFKDSDYIFYESRPRQKQVPKDNIQLICPGVDIGDPLVCTLTLNSSDKGPRTVRLTITGSTLLDHRIMSLDPGSHSFTFQTDTRYSPRCWVQACLINGRKNEEECALVRQYVPVQPAHRLVNLSLETDKELYAPGDFCRVDMRATDRYGNPLANAEISLGVVDESVFNVREDRLRLFRRLHTSPGHSFVHRSLDVSDHIKSDHIWMGAKPVWGYPGHEIPRWFSESTDVRVLKPARGHFGGGRDDGEGMPPRRDFRETAYWVATLLTDDDGRAHCSFNLPDTIADWRFTARCLDAANMLGEIRTTRPSLLPLSVEYNLPRASRVGDRIAPKIIVHNNSETNRLVTVRWQGADQAEGQEAMALEAQHDAGLSLPMLDIGQAPLCLQASVRDKDSGDEDGIHKTLAALPQGHPVQRCFAGRDACQFELPRPENLMPGSAFVDIHIEKGPVTFIADTLEVTDYCGYSGNGNDIHMDQLLMAVLAKQAMANVGLRLEGEHTIPTVITKNLSTLGNLQNEDGGWGNTILEDTNHHVTARFLHGLLVCCDAGQKVPKEMIAAARDNLRHHLAAGTLSGPRPHGAAAISLETAAIHALAHGCKNAAEQTALLTRLQAQRVEQRHAEETLYRAEAFYFLGEREAAKAALEASSQEAGGISRHPLRSAAMALRLRTLLYGPQTSVVGLITQRRKHRYSVLTKTDIELVRTLSHYAKIPDPQPGGPLRILFDGKVMRSIPIRQPFRQSIRMPIGPGIGQLRIEGGSDVFWTAHWRGTLAQMPAPPENPIASVAYQLINKGKTIPLAKTIAVPRGRNLTLLVTCELTRELEFVRLSIPRPAGITFIQSPRSGYRSNIAAIEERDEALHCFINHWPAGRYELRFLIQAERPGDVASPLPELVPMYEENLPILRLGPERWLIR